MRIKWIGKFSGDNLPAVDLDTKAKALPDVSNKSALMLIPIFLVIVACVYCKSLLHNGVVLTKGNLAIGFIIGFLFFPIHELFHGISFPIPSDVYMFYTMQGLGTTCTTPVSRNRFIVINIIPSIILGVIPLLIFMIVPGDYALTNAILFSVSFLHLGGSYADYVNVIHLLRLPKNAIIQISGAKIYWYLKDCLL